MSNRDPYSDCHNLAGFAGAYTYDGREWVPSTDFLAVPNV